MLKPKALAFDTFGTVVDWRSSVIREFEQFADDWRAGYPPAMDRVRRGELPWDCVISAELFRHYKPDPEAYLGCADLLDVAPGELMLVAAHASDLRGAQRAGLMTAWVDRPLEYGAGRRRPSKIADGEFGVMATDFGDLAISSAHDPPRVVRESRAERTNHPHTAQVA